MKRSNCQIMIMPVNDTKRLVDSVNLHKVSQKMPSSVDVDSDLWLLPAAFLQGRRSKGRSRRSRSRVSSSVSRSSRLSSRSSPYSATSMFLCGLGVLLFRCLITAMAYDKKFVTQL